MLRQATLHEYNICTSASNTRKRIMSTKNSITVEWKIMGTTVAEKIEILKRNKIVQTLYSINPIYLNNE